VLTKLCTKIPLSVNKWENLRDDISRGTLQNCYDASGDK